MEKLEQMRVELANKLIEVEQLDREYRVEFMKKVEEDIKKLKIMSEIAIVEINHNNVLVLISKNKTTYSGGTLRRSTVQTPIDKFAERRQLKVSSYLRDDKLYIELSMPR